MASGIELSTFMLATLLYAFMPGPAMLYSIAQTISGGRRVGLMAAFGLHIGGYFHVVMAVLGLSAILTARPELYSIVQKLGALYLVWLGFRRIFLTKQVCGAVLLDGSATQTRRTFIDSVIVDVLNPKAAIFYLAFLPQFVNEQGSVAIWLQMLILGVVTNISFSSADFISVLLSDNLKIRFNSNKVWVESLARWAGSIFIILGVMAFMNTSS
ncbi:LysE family translocator [Vibrio europaeus]|uniref:LysE family translocator n=1 Tax=Vibrio europaeus TaxID=300876 RepID=A0A178JDC5_9VIBR|nr:LysE family translocator [Vibrio europaeus]MDC5707646.1 LysE family translocator [Vibrio europaeus]MDC5709892.1 LysE family translocator [Vibrio europaeus]MDC5716631.1 LysE family translocator [Vibrio europaeus]MDC5722749.1 LysE family translocator [Vibrio europaeus]MDC5726951.1 LysE family translocator [Vibrio europaeus]